MKTALLLSILSSAALAQTSVPAPGNVTLPLDEYNRLIELSSQPPRKSDAPPFPYVVKSAQMALAVKGDLVSGSVLLEGDILAKGDRKVPLASGMIVREARQQGRELPLELEGAAHVAVLAGEAAFAVTLDAAIPLAIETGRASFSLPVPAAGASRLTLSVPGEQTQVNLSPGLITSRTSRNGQTVIEATLVPGQIANIWWAARNAPAPLAAPKEVRFLSDVKTLISVSESDLNIAALAEISILQGDSAQFQIQLPEDYEVTGVTGPTLLSNESQSNNLVLKVTDPSARSHQFLISLARANPATKAEVPLLTFQGTQRETGEVLIEGEGAIELAAAERGGLRRMDLKEASPYLRALASSTLHTAFRYQKRPGEQPVIALEWTRFPDAKLLSAVAQQAVVTTLVTTEGRSLTEVKLTVRNQSQPFLKVDLPAGSNILSAEVAGERVKPVTASDGNRVPLLRPGYRPEGTYAVSFIFEHAGTPFAKKGAADLALPKMDIPVGRVEWEVFLPAQYRVSHFGGDAVPQSLFPPPGEDTREDAIFVPATGPVNLGALGIGQIGGIVTDTTGAIVANARVDLVAAATGATHSTFADANGRWMIANIPSGLVRVSVQVPGFRMMVQEVNYDASRGRRVDLRLEVGSATESVTVNAEAQSLSTLSSQLGLSNRADRFERVAPPKVAALDTSPSVNVNDLQRRVAGVLPIAVNIPHTGNAYRFVRPLVVDDETRLTFNYRR